MESKIVAAMHLVLLPLVWRTGCPAYAAAATPSAIKLMGIDEAGEISGRTNSKSAITSLGTLTADRSAGGLSRCTPRGPLVFRAIMTVRKASNDAGVFLVSY